MRSALVLLVLAVLHFNLYAQDYYKISGKVTDSQTHLPLAFTAVYVSGNQYIGTVSNDSGEFVLKIAKNSLADSIRFSFVGYKTISLPLDKPLEDKNLGIISLQEHVAVLEEVTITPLDPQELIDKAIAKIPDNYDVHPIMLTGFYREIQLIKPVDFKPAKPGNETFTKEAVFKIYRGGYNANPAKEAEKDYMKLVAWRKSAEIEDSVVASALGGLKGTGPNNILNNDPLKDIKDSPLGKSNRKNYNFTLTEITEYENLRVYVVAFDQADNVKEQLYKGIMYIDAASFAIVSLEYGLSPKGSKYTKFEKVLFISAKLNSMSKKIIYKKYNDKWNVYFVENKGNIDLSLYNTFLTRSMFRKNHPDRKSITYNTDFKSQFIMTNVEKQQVVKFTKDELFKPSTEVKTEINKDNDDIWGQYNYIKMP